jgi:hypothetical protein
MDPIYPPLLLDYAFSTDPAPIAVSTTQVTTQARVNASVGPASGQKVYCNEIAVRVPVDADGIPSSDSLFGVAPSGSVSTNKWSVDGETRKGTDQDYTTFIYKSRDSPSLIDYNLVLGVFGAVNPLIGDAVIQIQERSGLDPSSLEIREGSFTLSKVLPEFYLKNLVATTDENPTTPITDFTNGVPIRLTWESNGTWFQLYAKGESQPIWSGTTTNYTLTKGVSRDTTFILVASMTGDPEHDTPDGGYEPIYLYEALTVTISNPVIEAATVNGALRVNGGTTLYGVAVNGTLTVEGSTAMEALTVNGLFGTAGPVSLFAAPALLASAVWISPTHVQALTDGIAILHFERPGNISVPVALWGVINISIDPSLAPLAFFATGGGNMDPAFPYFPTTLTLPIRKGTQWSFQSGVQSGDPQGAWKTEIWWFPMGVGPDGGPTFEILPSGDQSDATGNG